MWNHLQFGFEYLKNKQLQFEFEYLNILAKLDGLYRRIREFWKIVHKNGYQKS